VENGSLDQSKQEGFFVNEEQSGAAENEENHNQHAQG